MISSTLSLAFSFTDIWQEKLPKRVKSELRASPISCPFNKMPMSTLLDCLPELESFDPETEKK